MSTRLSKIHDNLHSETRDVSSLIDELKHEHDGMQEELETRERTDSVVHRRLKEIRSDMDSVEHRLKELLKKYQSLDEALQQRQAAAERKMDCLSFEMDREMKHVGKSKQFYKDAAPA